MELRGIAYLGVSCLALVPYRQHVDTISTRQVTVQGNETVASLRNDQFAYIASHGAADHGMSLQDACCVDDCGTRPAGGSGIGGGKKIEYPV